MLGFTLRAVAICAIVTTLFFSINRPQAVEVTAGTIETIENFSSEFVTPRHIHIWKPENYNKNTRHSVIYMHDGQMLFDANTTWNNQEWGVDEVASALQQEKSTRPFIVVAINNGGDALRYIEYLPQKPYQRLTPEQKLKQFSAFDAPLPTDLSNVVISDKYLRFVVEELKPFIDKNYSVHSDRANTFIMGSSMGGLISMYALAEYPDVFGGAACLSTHWPGGSVAQTNAITEQFMQYLRTDFPASGQHKIYFDHGDETLDAYYPPLQAKVNEIMQDRGYNDENWLTVFAPGDAHNEIAWNKRLHKPLLFLLGN